MRRGLDRAAGILLSSIAGPSRHITALSAAGGHFIRGAGVDISPGGCVVLHIDDRPAAAQKATGAVSGDRRTDCAGADVEMLSATPSAASRGRRRAMHEHDRLRLESL